MNYDIIVVGAGHAGCEAAYAAAKIGNKTLLITINKKNIADMSCNPSIGGTAKGIVVREIDALGGLMGIVADNSHFQIKMLNSGKGPAVRSLRAQADKVLYPKTMIKFLESEKNLTILENSVHNLIVENNIIKGVLLDNNEKIYCKALVLTTGTYLCSKILIGSKSKIEGPHGEKNELYLSKNLEKLGFKLLRLKTGTPQRIEASSINFDVLEKETGDNKYYTFSFDTKPKYDINNQRDCYLLYTNEETHNIILNNLDKSSMYGGYVEGVGPRYCPSIEDKLVRFKDKERHQLFLEPESNFYDEWYLQGFSTSMPIDIQEKMVHSLKGLENAKISKYAYAIEYDAIDPLQLKPSLETKIINNLFTAGQINGTSGYEEAAGQGLIAGINASLKIKNKEPLILKRNESYIGVLIDDLVSKGTLEPYRLLTSRAEFRLLLRHDNADLRLREYGYNTGLINEKQYNRLIKKKESILELIERLNSTSLKKNEKNKDIFNENSISVPSKNITLASLLKIPNINIDFLKNFIDLNYEEEVLEQAEIEIKYEGYIKKQNEEVNKLLRLESKEIPDNINYDKILNIASEARQKLNKIRPLTIAQASRISGVNPSDIAILSVYLKKEYSANEKR